MKDCLIERRMQRRVEATLPLRVRGVDAEGEEFEETTETLDVSRRGLSFLTRRDLPLLSVLTILIPNRSSAKAGKESGEFFSAASVVEVQKQEEGNRAGVRFMGASLNMYSPETT
jgi:hypothetical protein